MARGIRMKRVLIVEDDTDMQEIYRNMFKDQADKYKVEILGDAVEAFRRLKKEIFDLVILDIIMEPMPGDSFFACARDDAEVREVPILVVTVLNPDDLAHFKKINHVDFLQKPITKEELFAKIASFLKA